MSQIIHKNKKLHHTVIILHHNDQPGYKSKSHPKQSIKLIMLGYCLEKEYFSQKCRIGCILETLHQSLELDFI